MPLDYSGRCRPKSSLMNCFRVRRAGLKPRRQSKTRCSNAASSLLLLANHTTPYSPRTFAAYSSAKI